MSADRMTIEEYREKLHEIEEDWRVAIVAIAESMDDRMTNLRCAVKAHQRALDKRYRRVTVALIVMVVLGASGATAGMLVLENERAVRDRAVQESRRRASREGCEARNAQNLAIVAFVGVAAPDLRGGAARAFPVVRDCQAYAEEATRLP